ncbi:WD40 repeat-like protein [Lentinus tigrinus ALCF2SS1-7]|uniref:WD40 repeat-like protein n=1 Tax=Lentinus tigrinus ALCF2SS1-7 TaxID=1328758 RepID=UPI00116633AE|nr:WD40 repeat-like protein [Lentinus tigrinus ALCF2SS1-7]
MVCPAYSNLRFAHSLNYGGHHTGGKQYIGHDAPVVAIAASPDSRYIASSADDGTVIIWSTMAPPREILLESGLTKSLSFSNTGDFLAAIHQSHRILIWRVVDGSLIISTDVLEQRLDSCVWSRDDGLDVVSLVGHTGYVRDACFSPCERYIATASRDRTVRLWNVADGSLIWRFTDHDAEVMHVIFSADGSTLASVDSDGQVCLHPVSRFVRDSAPLASLTV